MTAVPSPAAAAPAANPTSHWLAHFPISFFAIVMGLAGFTIAIEKAEHVWAIPPLVSPVLFALSATIYAVIAAIYLAKWRAFPAQVTHELAHPVRLSFFPTLSISLILLSVAGLPLLPQSAVLVLWAVGSSVQLLLTLFILSEWMHQTHFEIHHSNPAWFIPIVGNILVPIAGVPLGFLEVSWFFFSIGLLFWIVLLTILMNRFFFHHPIASKLLPTLFILIAPPAVGFLSWTRLHGGQLDDFGRILYYAGLFTTLLLLFQSARFAKVKFALPWWAYSFPTAAITIASLTMFEKVGGTFFLALSLVLFTALTLLILVLVGHTVNALIRHQIFHPE